MKKKPFDPESLFGPPWHDKSLAVYPTQRAELDAARSGKKPMSIAGTQIAWMLDGEEYFVELLRLAFERELVVVLDSELTPRVAFDQHSVGIRIARSDELWRVPALRALYKAAFTDGIWTAAADMQLSILLGYTDAQRKKWLRWLRQAGSFALPIYTLLTAEQKAHVASVGQRCFGEPEVVTGMTLFVRNAGRVKKNAYRLVPKGLTLARSSLHIEQGRALFGDWRTKPGVTYHPLQPTKKQAIVLNRELRSNVQFLTASGWK